MIYTAADRATPQTVYIVVRIGLQDSLAANRTDLAAYRMDVVEAIRTYGQPGNIQKR